MQALVRYNAAKRNKIKPATAGDYMEFCGKMTLIFELLSWEEQITMAVKFKPFFDEMRNKMDDEQVLAVLLLR